LVDTKEIIIFLYENYKLSLRIKDLDIRLKVRCGFHNDYCKEHCVEKERQHVINIDYSYELDNFLDEFLRSNQVSFDRFEVQCVNLVEKVHQSEKKLVEIEAERLAIVMERENLKIKNSGMEEKSQVRCVNLGVTFETQPLEIKEILLQQEFYSSLLSEITIFRCLLLGA